MTAPQPLAEFNGTDLFQVMLSGISCGRNFCPPSSKKASAYTNGSPDPLQAYGRRRGLHVRMMLRSVRRAERRANVSFSLMIFMPGSGVACCLAQIGVRCVRRSWSRSADSCQRM